MLSCERSVSQAIDLCVAVTGQPNCEFNFNVQSLKDNLQRIDLDDWKVKIIEEREILNEVSKGEHTCMKHITK